MEKYIIENMHISSLIQMEYSALEEATVPICSFVLCNDDGKDGIYFRLTDFSGGMKVQEQKYLEFNNNKNPKYVEQTRKTNELDYNYNVKKQEFTIINEQCKKLEKDLEKNKKYIGSKQVEYEYKHKYSKSIIDDIDRIIGKIYNFGINLK